jgi:hypothetical protein
MSRGCEDTDASSRKEMDPADFAKKNANYDEDQNAFCSPVCLALLPNLNRQFDLLVSICSPTLAVTTGR